jgi:K+:H+ antiporter
MTVPHQESARLAIMNARKMRLDLPIMARSHHREEYSYLMDAGATEVIQPETEASATFIRHACGHYLMIPDSQIRVYLRSFRDVADSAQRMPAKSQQRVPEVREVIVLNSSLTGRSLRDMKLRESFGVTVVSVRRNSGEMLTNPPADTVLQQSDRLRVLGLSHEIDVFAARCSGTDAFREDTGPV